MKHSKLNGHSIFTIKLYSPSRDNTAKLLKHTSPLPQILKCERCDGCGRIDNGDEGTAWSFWESLPEASKLAVRMGLVKIQEPPLPPITKCPWCHSGKQFANTYEIDYMCGTQYQSDTGKF